MGNKRTKLFIPALAALMLFGQAVLGANISSQASGNWSSGATWVGGVPPGINDVVTISSGDSVRVDVASSCDDLLIQGTGRLQIDATLDVTDLLQASSTGSSQTSRIHVNALTTCTRFYCLALNPGFKVVVDGSSRLETDFSSTIGAFIGWSGSLSTAVGDYYIRCDMRVYQLRAQRPKGMMTIHVEDSISIADRIDFLGGSVTTNIIDVDHSNAVLDWSGEIEFYGTRGSFVNSASGATFYIDDASLLLNDSKIDYNNVFITSGTSSALQNSFTCLGDLTILSGAQFNSNGNNVTIGGGLTNNGTISTSTTETWTFNSRATSNESMSGSGISLPRVVLGTDVSGGLTVNVSDTLNITVGLELDSGTFTTNTKTRLFSDASRTAYLGRIGTSAALDGNLIVRKYIDGVTGDARWVYLHVPLSGAAVSSVQEGTSPVGIYTYGFTGSNDPSVATYRSTYTYDESAPTTSFDEGWIAETNASNTFNYTNGRIFRMGGSYGVGAKSTYILQVGGAVVGGTASITGKANSGSTGTGSNDGWHLGANPYPCPVQFLSANATNIQGNEVYIYDSDAVGDWVTVDNGATIPAWQTFFYQVSSTPGSYTFNEADKVESATTAFLRRAPNASQVVFTLMSDSLQKGGQAFLEFKDGAEVGFDGNDAYGLRNLWPNPNMRVIVNDSIPVQKNRIPRNMAEYSFPLEIDVELAGEYTLTVDNLPGSGTCQSIEDLTTGVTMTLDESFSYTFTQTNLDPEQRFIVNILNPADEPSITHASCFEAEDGSASITVDASFGAYNLIVRSEDGMEVYNEAGQGTNSVEDLAAGVYTIEILKDDLSCELVESFEIFEPELVTSDFSISNLTPNIHPSAGESVDFTNNSTGANDFVWDFGDGNQSTDVNPSHSYSEAGTYEVKLTAGNGTANCNVTHSALVQALNNAPASTIEVEEEKPYSIFSSDMISLSVDEPASVVVANTLGQEVYSNDRVVGLDIIDLKSSGVYLINIQMGGKSFSEKVVLNK
jgi:PKD repeat protein